MARKKWFRVGDSVLREDWDDRTLATVIRLLAWLHQRWSRDGIPNGQAGTAFIGPLDCMAITGIKRPKEAAKFLASLPLAAGLRSARAQLVTTKSATSVALDWPNFLIFQDLISRNDPESVPKRSPPRTETETERVRRRSGPPVPPSQRSSDRLVTDEIRGLDLDTLPLATADRLLGVHPQGVERSKGDLACWFAAKAPVMRARGYKRLDRTATAWWPRATGDEIKAARDWVSMRRLEAHRVAAESAPETPQDRAGAAIIKIEDWG